jgi:transposase-like protein
VPPVDRNNPKRADSSESDYSIIEFMREFPDDATCLEWLWRNRFSDDGSHAECPQCDRTRKFHKVNDRPAWDCDTCGYHLHPTAGTIFHKSSTSLQLWFYAMHLMTSTRCAISAKQLERELGVTYKTAWRMANLIRNQLMVQDDEPLSGEVEADETWIGGKPRAAEIRRSREAAHPAQARNRAFAARKTSVFGAVERGGRVRVTVVLDSSSATLGPLLYEYVLPSSTIFTDEWKAYETPGKQFKAHLRIAHKENIYVSGNVHTNTIEGFFSLVKNGIRGVYHSASKKWLQGYLNEYAWRYNQRRSLTDRRAMFHALLSRAAGGA